jgi:hypothetical protein
MSDAAYEPAPRPEVEPVPEPASAPDATEAPADGSELHGGASPCPVAWCPVCITVGAVQPIRPDVVEHLLKAGTEMLLAFRAVVDARADDVTGASDEGDGGSTKLEKIELG